MKVIQNVGQRVVLEYITKHRWGFGVSPTMREVASATGVPFETARSRMHALLRDGWLEKVEGGEHGERNYVPTLEARLVERMGEVLLTLQRLASEDARAAELLAYATGTRVSQTVSTLSGHPIPTETQLTG